MGTFWKRSRLWIGLLLLTDAAYLLMVWIVRQEAAPYAAAFLILFTLLVCVLGIYAAYRSQKREERVFLRFLQHPDEKTKGELLAFCGGSPALEALTERLFQLQARVNEKETELAAYQEYIEGWVHEIKTPMSLMMLVLSNHKEEMSPYVHDRMQYAGHKIQQDVSRILYYARLQADHPDEKFVKFPLNACVEEVVEEYRPYAAERNIRINLNLKELSVISDRRVVSFLLCQLLDNAVKYADSQEGRIAISMSQEQDKIRLGIYNNGPGVPPEDKPFLFDKGFTGNHPSRQAATGMGLYLVSKYGEKLNIEVHLGEKLPYESGFGIEMIFTL